MILGFMLHYGCFGRAAAGTVHLQQDNVFVLALLFHLERRCCLTSLQSKKGVNARLGVNRNRFSNLVGIILEAL